MQLFDKLETDNEPATDANKSRMMLELLKHRHPAPEWATFAELATGTGYGGRWIDFFAMNLWPSNGNLKIAYEIKASRSDFNREMNKPDKRKNAEKLADECYFVCPHGLLSPEEMPEGWGLLVMNKGGLRMVKRATQRRVENLPISFVMSLARRTSDPPSTLPASVWLHAGKEVPESALRDLANENTKKAIQEAEWKAEERVRQSSDYKQANDVRSVVIDCLGHGYVNPDRLRERLSGDGKQKPLDPFTEHRLKKISEQANAILKELYDSGHLSKIW